ncbi:helix-turn-helix domain-containing protein [Sneathiella aquimaris]|uniref:helix-turn-helix domain-containing protein n=1 Tax=Sneathiella aquimaris TaxID=2599305 RepID=UPI001469E086
MRTYTINQFCEAFNTSRRSLYNLWERGEGPARKYRGKTVLITNEAAEKWLSGLPDKREVA